LNGTLHILLRAKDANLFGGNKLSVKEKKEGLCWSMAMRLV